MLAWIRVILFLIYHVNLREQSPRGQDQPKHGSYAWYLEPNPETPGNPCLRVRCQTAASLVQQRVDFF